MNRAVRPAACPVAAADSRARTVVVPTAMTRRPSERAWRHASRVDSGTAYASVCTRWSSGRSAVTGRKVPSPTVRSTVMRCAPARRHLSPLLGQGGVQEGHDPAAVRVRLFVFVFVFGARPAADREGGALTRDQGGARGDAAARS